MHRSRKLRPLLSTSGFVFLRTESQTVSIPLTSPLILILSDSVCEEKLREKNKTRKWELTLLVLFPFNPISRNI